MYSIQKKTPKPASKTPSNPCLKPENPLIRHQFEVSFLGQLLQFLASQNKNPPAQMNKTLYYYFFYQPLKTLTKKIPKFENNQKHSIPFT